jgi:hypothetical protein
VADVIDTVRQLPFGHTIKYSKHADYPHQREKGALPPALAILLRPIPSFHFSGPPKYQRMVVHRYRYGVSLRQLYCNIAVQGHEPLIERE